MESCLKFLPRKSYNRFGNIVLTLFFVVGVTLIGFASDLKAKTDLHCNLDKNVGIQNSRNVETTCSLKYEQKYNSPLPLYKCVILNFGLGLALCMIYAVSVKYRIELWDRLTTRTRTHDTEGQPLTQPEIPEPNQDDVTNPHIPVFFIYIFHLVFARLLPMILFVVLVFYPAYFPTTFSCSLPTPSSTNSNMTDLFNQHNFTIDCTNPSSSSSMSLATAVWIVDVMISLIALVELIYLVWMYWMDNDFASDIEFCSVYLLRKRKRIRKIVKNYRNKLDKDKDVFQLDIQTGGKRKIDDMYVKVVIQEGRERRNRGQEFKRHEIYEIYLKLPKEPIEKIEHVFLPGKNNKQLPRKILVVGRPGIGKTVLTKKILYQWKTEAHEVYAGKLLILIRFRTFNDEHNKTTTLKKMLRLGDGLPTGDFDSLYQYILLFPKRVILILDGLDELKVDGDKCWGDEQDIPDDYNQTMSMFSVFKKLICNNFLPGAIVVTTSRPTAEHIYSKLTFDRQVEILGFTEKEIQNYVKKFCQSDILSSKIWKSIQESAELLSLCYIPVSCYITCLTLKKCIKDEGSESDLPRTMTELYKRAIRIILWDHEPEYKRKANERDFLTAELPEKLQGIVNNLKPEATTGMENRELIFKCKTQDKIHAIRDCGLLTSVPGPSDDESYYYYCFLHLTIQEFLAAWHFVDNIKELDVDIFLSNHIKNPNWHLVIQFFAGLLGDKFRENKLSKETMDKICQSFADWISFHDRSNETWNVTLLMIKCLYEIQQGLGDILKSAANKVDGGGNDGCSLRNLNIAPVDCAALFQFLRHVKNLRELNLSYNNVGDHGCLELANFLQKNNHLFELNLRDIKIGDKGVEHLCKVLKHENCKLTNLNLAGNNISDKAVEHLSNALKNENCKLTNLILEANNITDKGAEHLCNALKIENCKLTNLNLDYNGIGDKGVEHLCNALKNENCKLTNLHLGENDIKVSDKGAEHLCNALKNENCKLTNLDVRGNMISDKGVEHLCNALKNEHCKLTNLNIDRNEISDKGVQHQCNALKHENCKLTNLNLGFTKISDGGVEQLCNALKHENCKLTNLNLDGNEISDKGAEHLCNALKHENCKLTNLNLWENKISDGGVEHLCNALKNENCKLTNLNLMVNKISDKDAEHLCNALKHENCKLTNLTLRDNKISDKGAEHICNALKNENCKLTNLNLMDNKISDEGAEHLRDAGKRNNVNIEI